MYFALQSKLSINLKRQLSKAADPYGVQRAVIDEQHHASSEIIADFVPKAVIDPGYG
jgi:hypothetical protein